MSAGSSLEIRREKTRKSLQSAFELIFAKYDREFEQEDEIDILEMKVTRQGRYLGQLPAKPFGSIYKKAPIVKPNDTAESPHCYKTPNNLAKDRGTADSQLFKVAPKLKKITYFRPVSSIGSTTIVLRRLIIAPHTSTRLFDEILWRLMRTLESSLHDETHQCSLPANQCFELFPICRCRTALLKIFDAADSSLPADRLQTLLAPNIDDLAKLLSYYKRPNGQPIKDASLNPKVMAVISEFSERAQLEESQALELYRSYEGLNSELVQPAADRASVTLAGLLDQLVAFYYKERSATLLLVLSIIRAAGDEAHPYQQQAEEFRSKLFTLSLPQRLLDTYATLIATCMPQHFTGDGPSMVQWAIQNLSEQKQVIETIFLLCNLAPSKLEQLSAIECFNVLSNRDFSSEQLNKDYFDDHACKLAIFVHHLCIVTAVKLFGIGDQLYSKEAQFSIAPKELSTLTAQLTSGNSFAMFVVLLAASVAIGLSSTVSSDVSFIQLAQHACQNGAFVAIKAILDSDECADGDNATHFKQVLKDLFTGLVFLFEVPLVPDYPRFFGSYLLILADQPSLVDQFWIYDYPLVERRSVLETCCDRFPYEFEPLLRLAHVLGSTSLGAQQVFHLLTRMSSIYTTRTPDRGFVEEKPNEDNDKIELKVIRPFEIYASGVALLLPPETRGVQCEVVGERPLVNWNVHLSFWELLPRLLERHGDPAGFEFSKSTLAATLFLRILESCPDLAKSIFQQANVISPLYLQPKATDLVSLLIYILALVANTSGQLQTFFVFAQLLVRLVDATDIEVLQDANLARLFGNDVFNIRHAFTTHFITHVQTLEFVHATLALLDFIDFFIIKKSLASTLDTSDLVTNATAFVLDEIVNRLPAWRMYSHKSKTKVLVASYKCLTGVLRSRKLSSIRMNRIPIGTVVVNHTFRKDHGILVILTIELFNDLDDGQDLCNDILHAIDALIESSGDSNVFLRFAMRELNIPGFKEPRSLISAIFSCLSRFLDPTPCLNLMCTIFKLPSALQLLSGVDQSAIDEFSKFAETELKNGSLSSKIAILNVMIRISECSTSFLEIFATFEGKSLFDTIAELTSYQDDSSFISLCLEFFASFWSKWSTKDSKAKAALLITIKDLLQRQPDQSILATGLSIIVLEMLNDATREYTSAIDNKKLRESVWAAFDTHLPIEPLEALIIAVSQYCTVATACLVSAEDIANIAQCVLEQLATRLDDVSCHCIEMACCAVSAILRSSDRLPDSSAFNSLAATILIDYLGRKPACNSSVLSSVYLVFRHKGQISLSLKCQLALQVFKAWPTCSQPAGSQTLFIATFFEAIVGAYDKPECRHAIREAGLVESIIQHFSHGDSIFLQDFITSLPLLLRDPIFAEDLLSAGLLHVMSSDDMQHAVVKNCKLARSFLLALSNILAHFLEHSHVMSSLLLAIKFIPAQINFACALSLTGTDDFDFLAAAFGFLSLFISLPMSDSFMPGSATFFADVMVETTNLVRSNHARFINKEAHALTNQGSKLLCALEAAIKFMAISSIFLKLPRDVLLHSSDVQNDMPSLADILGLLVQRPIVTNDSALSDACLILLSSNLMPDQVHLDLYKTARPRLAQPGTDYSPFARVLAESLQPVNPK